MPLLGGCFLSDEDKHEKARNDGDTDLFQDVAANCFFLPAHGESIEV